MYYVILNVTTTDNEMQTVVRLEVKLRCVSQNSTCCVTSRHITTQARRVVRVVTCCVVRAVPCLLQHGVRQRSSSARM